MKKPSGVRRKDFFENRGDCPDFEPSHVLAPFASPFLGPVEPVFLEADRLVRQTA